MTVNALCPEQVSALEFQTAQAYEALKKALDTRHQQDAIWAVKVYSGLQASLNVATNYGNYTGLKRDKKLPLVLDKSVLQYVIGDISSLVLENTTQDRRYGRERKAEKTEITEESMKGAIASDVSFMELKSMAMKLAKAHKYDDILNVLRYVREEYSR